MFFERLSLSAQDLQAAEGRAEANFKDSLKKMKDNDLAAFIDIFEMAGETARWAKIT